MARRAPRTTSRMRLRDEAAAVEKIETEAPVKKKAAKKAPAKPKKSKKKVEITRLRVVWGIFDNSYQQVATYPYPDKDSADKRAKELSDRGRGNYIVQRVKEPIPESELKPEPSAEAE